MATTGLDLRTLEQLNREGIDPSSLKERKTPSREQPYTSAGLPSLRVFDTPELQDTNTEAFMLGSNRVADFDKFDELIGEKSGAQRKQFVKDVIGAAEHLKTKYGIEDAYFDPRMLEQGGTALYEQLASLAGYEAANNVDLTKDPVLRKTLFKNKEVRETYNAITGLRQTRLDARDLPPYTRQSEPAEPGMMDKLKKMIGYANGGYVENVGNNKLI